LDRIDNFEKGIDKMESNRRLSPLAALVIIIGIACATFIGYKIAQNNRYTPMNIGKFSILWDNWKNEPVLEPNSEAERCYFLLYGERIIKKD
jgi:hypothetical protein